MGRKAEQWISDKLALEFCFENTDVLSSKTVDWLWKFETRIKQQRPLSERQRQIVEDVKRDIMRIRGSQEQAKKDFSKKRPPPPAYYDDNSSPNMVQGGGCG